MTDKKQQFENWVSQMDIRIFDWAEEKVTEIDFALDFSEESLIKLEQYLLDNFKSEDLKSNDKFVELDAIVSYVGETFRKLLLKSNWSIELEVEDSVYFNLPCIKPKYGGPFSVHQLIQRILAQGKIGVLDKKLVGVRQMEDMLAKANQ